MIWSAGNPWVENKKYKTAKGSRGSHISQKTSVHGCPLRTAKHWLLNGDVRSRQSYSIDQRNSCIFSSDLKSFACASLFSSCLVPYSLSRGSYSYSSGLNFMINVRSPTGFRTL